MPGIIRRERLCNLHKCLHCVSVFAVRQRCRSILHILGSMRIAIGLLVVLPLRASLARCSRNKRPMQTTSTSSARSGLKFLTRSAWFTSTTRPGSPRFCFFWLFRCRYVSRIMAQKSWPICAAGKIESRNRVCAPLAIKPLFMLRVRAPKWPRGCPGWSRRRAIASVNRKSGRNADDRKARRTEPARLSLDTSGDYCDLHGRIARRFAAGDATDVVVQQKSAARQYDDCRSAARTPLAGGQSEFSRTSVGAGRAICIDRGSESRQWRSDSRLAFFHSTESVYRRVLLDRNAEAVRQRYCGDRSCQWRAHPRPRRSEQTLYLPRTCDLSIEL